MIYIVNKLIIFLLPITKPSTAKTPLTKI